MQYGYDQAREDALLDAIDWPNDGYRLFEIGTMDDSSVDGWFQSISESNALFLRRELWELLGGVDERFDAPGGGLMNLDTYRRAGELPDAELVILLGEATFHQLHGGVSTNGSLESLSGLLAGWCKQYETIRGYSFACPKLKNAPTYLGTVPRPALARFVRAATDPVQGYRPQEPPLGPHFDRELWSLAPSALPADPTIAALVALAQNEFRERRYEAAAAVSRLVRERAPDEPEPQRLLSLIGSSLSGDDVPSERRADYHLALGEAHRMLGENEKAAANYRAALTFNRNLHQARFGLAILRMPEDDGVLFERALRGDESYDMEG
jgi:tetratricopeptide (TPR) repeat protein